VIKTAVIVDSRHSDTVGIGSKVKVVKDATHASSDMNSANSTTGEQVYKIVGSEEADMIHNKVSNLSPLGSALLGKRAGEAFIISTPKGKIGYKLISIEK